MSSATRSSHGADVPLGRLLALSAIVFLLVLAFLAGRVHAGADPAQVAAPTPTSTSSSSGSDPYGAPFEYQAPGAQPTQPRDGSVAPPTTQAS